MKKSLLFRELAMKNIDLFCCPVCGEAFDIRELTFVCGNKHTFDISKKGYVNFVLNYKVASYGKALFMARKNVAEAGFFEPLHEMISGLIHKYKNNGYILDAGCGEGSALNSITHRFQNFCGIGIDISKDAIMQTEQSEKSIFFVGDIAKLPIRSSSIDILLNILTSAHYSEFSRLLTNGILIKVIPNAAYLKEIRELYYANSNRKNYDNETTVLHFRKNFNCIEEIDCAYSFAVNTETLKDILSMTPLLWNYDDKSLGLTESNITHITCDFKILVGISRIADKLM